MNTRIELDYLRRLFARKEMAARVVMMVMIAVSAAFLEGVGVGTLIPIVESLQGKEQSGSTSGISGMFAGTLHFFGLPFVLPVVLVLALAIFFSESLLVYVLTVLLSRTQNKLVLDLRSQAFSNLLHFDIEFVNRSRGGDLVNKLITESNRAGYSLKAMVEMLSVLCLLISYAVMEVFISWQLALVSFPLLAAVAVLLRPRQSYQLGLQKSTQNESLQSIAMETIAGMKTVVSLGLGKMVGRRFVEAAQALTLIENHLNEKAGRFALIYQSTVVTIIVGLVYFAASFGQPMASVLVFLVVLQRMAPRVGLFAEHRHWWLGAANSLEQAETLIQETGKASARVANGSVQFDRLKHGIQLCGVTFRHSGHSTDTLSGIELFIPVGKMTAIVGHSGSGKSTLLDLVARFYDPSSGSILVDGRDVREFEITSWRKAIGFVSQDAFLFNDSIENNIRYGDFSATKESIIKAAKESYADGFIATLPEGYKAVVGDRGVKLSGGQRQRIVLARTILRRPQILILDEATSDLDSESEQYIQQAIAEIGRTCTVIVVAHRLSTVEHADTIAVLEKGRVLEQGVLAELLAQRGRFAQYYQLQYGDIVAGQKS